MSQKDYLKSNRITGVKLRVSEDAKILAQRLLVTDDDRRREFYSDAIVHDLCDAAGIPACVVEIADRPQLHRKNQRGVLRLKILGHYTPGSKKIVVYNRTAVRQKVVAGKTFLRCLMHEFMHRYDYHVLKIQSLHTAGFYQRLSAVLEKLSPNSS